MPEPTSLKAAPKAPRARAATLPGPLFLGVIDAILVPDPADSDFDGAVSRSDAAAIWTWMRRDLAPDLIEDGAEGEAAAEACAAAWADAAAPLQDDAARDWPAAVRYAGYYVAEILRKPPKRADCQG